MLLTLLRASKTSRSFSLSRRSRTQFSRSSESGTSAGFLRMAFRRGRIAHRRRRMFGTWSLCRARSGLKNHSLKKEREYSSNVTQHASMKRALWKQLLPAAKSENGQKSTATFRGVQYVLSMMRKFSM